MGDPSKYVELDVIEGSFWWASWITGIAFGGEEYALPPIEAITDTGTSCTYIPTTYFHPIMSHLKGITPSLYEYNGF